MGLSLRDCQATETASSGRFLEIGNMQRKTTFERLESRKLLASDISFNSSLGRVLIEGNDGSRLRHDRPPLYCGSARALAGEE